MKNHYNIIKIRLTGLLITIIFLLSITALEVRANSIPAESSASVTLHELSCDDLQEMLLVALQRKAELHVQMSQLSSQLSLLKMELASYETLTSPGMSAPTFAGIWWWSKIGQLREQIADLEILLGEIQDCLDCTEELIDEILCRMEEKGCWEETETR